MTQQTEALVLRSIKYGDSSLVTTLFTEAFGVQAYLVQGIRKASSTQQKSGQLQPGTLLHIVSDQRPFKNLLRLREFSPATIWKEIPQDIRRNSVALFAVELLYRLLPEKAPFPELFAFTKTFFEELDEVSDAALAHYPLFFATQCGSLAGYDIFDAATGEITQELQLSPAERTAFTQFLKGTQLRDLPNVSIASSLRKNLLNSYVNFLQAHCQHMSSLKTLSVLEVILHA